MRILQSSTKDGMIQKVRISTMVVVQLSWKTAILRFAAKERYYGWSNPLLVLQSNSNVALPQDPGEEPVTATTPTAPTAPENLKSEVPAEKEVPVPPACPLTR